MFLPCKHCKHERWNHFYCKSSDILVPGEPPRQYVKNCDKEVNYLINCGCRRYEEMTNLEYIEYESERVQVVQEDLRNT